MGSDAVIPEDNSVGSPLDTDLVICAFIDVVIQKPEDRFLDNVRQLRWETKRFTYRTLRASNR